MAKPISFQLHVTDAQGQPVGAAQVTGALTMKVMDMGTTKLTFSPKGSGDYEASVKGLDMSGPWGLAVTVRQGNAAASQNFEISVFD